MRILYIGDADSRSNSRNRADALTRLGHEVVLADPYAALAPQLCGRVKAALHYRSGYRLLQPNVGRWVRGLIAKYEAKAPDIVWVNGGELLGRRAVNLLREFDCPLVLYNNDDPTGVRDGRRFDSLLKALPAYDLCVVCRPPNVDEFLRQGARKVHRVWMNYDNVIHRQFDDVTQIPAPFKSEIAFIGTMIPGEDRDGFLLSLIDHGLNITIWGDRWQKAPTWRRLQPYWRGGALAGRDYVAAIQGSKIALGLLSHGNRDLHTSRSVEVPYAGGLLCAERTAEHLAMYREGVEAVFWKDAEECAAVCHRLLADDGLRERIRQQGMARVRQGGYGNEAVCQDILSKVASL